MEEEEGEVDIVVRATRVVGREKERRRRRRRVCGRWRRRKRKGGGIGFVGEGGAGGVVREDGGCVDDVYIVGAGVVRV